MRDNFNELLEEVKARAYHASDRVQGTMSLTRGEGSTGMPPVPNAIKAQERLADQASPTLDAMIAFFRYWATRSYDGFHEAVALWTLSTIAARRVYLPWQDGIWTPFYILLVATSSTHAKSKAMSYGVKILRDAGLDFLLAPDEITPQKLMSNMAGSRLPRNYSTLPPEKQEFIRLRTAFSGQRGWAYDEFGNKLQEIIKGQGHNAYFHGLLKQLYDNKKSYEYDTIQRDNEHIDMPSLSIIGTATLSCLKPIATPDSPLWSDGTFARIAFVVAPENELKLQSAPNETCFIPERILSALQGWHQRLGIPTCQIVDADDQTAADEAVGVTSSKKRKDGDSYTILKGDLPQAPCTMPHEVYQAYQSYLEALVMLAHEHKLDEGFRSFYTRLVDMALRIAMLLASLENDGHMDMRHWGRAQQITEHWRANFHDLVRQLSRTGDTSKNYNEMESLALSVLETTTSPMTAREISRKSNKLNALGSKRVGDLLDTLAKSEPIEMVRDGRKVTYHLKSSLAGVG